MATDPHEHLGAAAIQGRSNSIPAPQGAFDRELLKDGEVHWAVTDDDVVVVSVDYDSLREEEGLAVFATSTLDDDRTLHIPAEAFDEWGDATDDDVGGGDTLHFVTTDEMESEGQVLVVPDAQARELDLLEE